MKLFSSVRSVVSALLHRARVERDTDQELRAHVQNRAEDLERSGLTRAEAERRARIEFGGHEKFKEECREALGTRIVEAFLQDLRFSFRMLRKSPGFAAVATLTLALGIGANTAIFTLLDRILLRSLPVKDPQQLVLLEIVGGQYYGNSSGDSVVSYPMYRDFQDHNEVFSSMFCHRFTSASLSFGGQAERVRIELVSGTYFSVLGVRPALGRTFTPDDDRVPNGEPLVVLNYAFWKQRFGGDPSIVGKTLLVNNRNMTVVGVAEAGFDGVEADRSANLFVPMMMQEAILGERKTPLLTDRRTRWTQAFGRLKPGETAEQAKASLQPFTHAMLEMEVQEPAFRHASAYDREQFLKSQLNTLPGAQGYSYARNDLRTPLWVLMATTGLVLLIACANLANLLLSRSTGRQKEIGVRLAIGASRGRILHQLLIESLVLSVLGALAGLALAFWADQALMAVYLGADTSGLNISTAPDARILFFTLGVTLLTGIAFGFAPALQSTKPDLNCTLKDEAGSVVRGGRDGLRQTLVIAQVAFSLVLLVGAGLFLRTLTNLRRVSPGFRAERLVGFELNPWLSGYTVEQSKNFYQRLTEDLRSIPGVQSVGLAAVRILDGSEWDSGLTVEGYSPSKPDDHPQAYMNKISPNYFATLGVPFVAGRDFTPQDGVALKKSPDQDEEESAPAVIINETFARRYFAGRNPIGLHLGFGTDPGTKTNMEIIGVVKDTKYTGLRDDIPEQAFLPYLAAGFTGQSQMTVYLRTAGDPAPVMRAAREKVRQMDARLPIYAMRTMEEQVSDSLATERMIASLSSVFGFLAALLATIGLYGVMAYAVARRTREIGIRIALGAEKRRLLWMVMRQVSLLVAVGLAAGIPAALALARLGSHWISGMLYGVPASDPVNLTLAALLMAGVALLAGFLPARRASRVDPIVALRYE
jgi:predicted permease